MFPGKGRRLCAVSPGVPQRRVIVDQRPVRLHTRQLPKFTQPALWTLPRASLPLPLNTLLLGKLRPQVSPTQECSLLVTIERPKQINLGVNPL